MKITDINKSMLPIKVKLNNNLKRAINIFSNIFSE